MSQGVKMPRWYLGAKEFAKDVLCIVAPIVFFCLIVATISFGSLLILGRI